MIPLKIPSRAPAGNRTEIIAGIPVAFFQEFLQEFLRCIQIFI